jgi:hypothetical protein
MNRYFSELLRRRAIRLSADVGYVKALCADNLSRDSLGIIIRLHARMPNAKPFVQAACICERILSEENNVHSLIRIGDTFNVEIPEGQVPGTKIGLPLMVFVSVKSGDVEGDSKMALQLISPDGKAQHKHEWPIALQGGENGASLKVSVMLGDPQEGLYWFDVLWNDEILTRIPARIRLTKPVGQQPG